MRIYVTVGIESDPPIEVTLDENYTGPLDDTALDKIATRLLDEAAMAVYTLCTSAEIVFQEDE